MPNELYKFLKKNGINNVVDFIQKSDFKIDGLQTNISNHELSGAEFSESKQIIIPLSQILGFSESNCRIDKSYFANFSSFFNSEISDGYHNRGIGMLNYSIEEIMTQLSKSFDDEPIKTISIDGKFYISSNGLHRFMALKLYYMLEIYQGKTPEELEQKYIIKVSNRELNVFKTFTQYFGSCLKPPIEYTNNISEIDWLVKVKERVKSFDENDYQLLVNNISFVHFINDTSGEVMIKYMCEYFPKITIDVFKNLIMSNKYECTTNIINCIKEHFPNYENELLQIINNSMNDNLQNMNNKNNFEYFDLNQKWDNYGIVRRISNHSKDSELFSEGSETLKKCLSIIWQQGIETTSCCKGNHLSINIYNKPEINCEAYISFTNNNWQKYLSSEIIKDEDVIIWDDAIYYYGRNNEMFFRMLARDFLTGKKNNSTLLNDKNNTVTKEMEYKSFINALEQIGFDEEEIKYLSDDYLEIEIKQKEFYSPNNINKDITVQNWDEAQKKYEEDLIFYINRHNQQLNSPIKK